MTWFLVMGGVAYLITVDGLVGAAAGMLGGLALDIPIAIVAGETFASIFTGWGLLDDVIMASLKLSVGVTDKFLIGLAIANATHIAEEGYEYYDHTDEQNRRYSEYLQRQNPGQTYLFGDVTRKDVFELGASLGVLAYRKRSVFQAATEFLGEFLGLEETADVIAIGGAL